MSALFKSPENSAVFRVRSMSQADVATVIATERAIYPFPWTEGNFHDSIKAGYDCRMFRLDDELIGYAIVMWLPDEVHLLNLSICADRHGQGLGRQALDWLIHDCQGRGSLSMLLEVRPSNRPAVRLYERAGFVAVGVRKRYYPSFENLREDAIVMRKVFDHG